MITSISQAEADSIGRVSAKLGMSDPAWLTDLINFETGGTFDPAIKNPLSSARGLIQFMDRTARGMGYSDSLDLVEQNPTFIKQLEGPVYEYLKPMGPFKTQYDLFMAVFFPVARKYDPDTSFEEIFKQHYGANWRPKYLKFSEANPAIKTPRDYMMWVQKKAGKFVIKKNTIALLVVGAITAWYLMRRKK